MKYDIDLLNTCLARDNAKVIEMNFKLGVKQIIKFLCSCGVEDTKRFDRLVNNGAYCKHCTNKTRIERKNKTMIERYGVINPLQNKEIQHKQQLSMIEKYGAANPLQINIIREKIRETNIKKYNTENPSQNSIIKEKRKLTFLKNYGVSNPQQNIEIQERTQKNSKKYKTYLTPNNEIRHVQGYEPFALDELFKIYVEDQIKTNRRDVPRVRYFANNKTSYYFPDIWIPHENKIIEVKSTWTHIHRNYNITEKTQACKDQNYNYEIWVYDNKGRKDIVT
jgi:hypothetical protein